MASATDRVDEDWRRDARRMEIFLQSAYVKLNTKTVDLYFTSSGYCDLFPIGWDLKHYGRGLEKFISRESTIQILHTYLDRVRASSLAFLEEKDKEWSNDQQGIEQFAERLFELRKIRQRLPKR